MLVYLPKTRAVINTDFVNHISVKTQEVESENGEMQEQEIGANILIEYDTGNQKYLALQTQETVEQIYQLIEDVRARL